MSTQAIRVLVQQLVTASKARRRRPSQRNTETHEAARVGGQAQLEGAARHRMTQRRVSAICRQVDRWRADEEAGGELTADVRQRAERWVARKRLEKVYGWSIRGLETSGETLRTSVNRRKGNELIEVQT